MQLERLLHQHGFGSRRECRALVRHRRVHIGGVVVEDPFADFPTDGLVFNVDGVDWPWMPFATVLLHKPAGYECSRQPRHHPSVLDLLPAPLRGRGVQPIGRLDHDTTGLLLLTDDGQLNHRVSSGKRKLPKTYRACLAQPAEEAQLAALLTGVLLHDEPAPLAAAAVERLDAVTLRITVTEGKYHQVKRMVAAAGNRVAALHREAVGGLVLPADLAPGSWRWLSAVDRKNLENFP